MSDLKLIDDITIFLSRDVIFLFFFSFKKYVPWILSFLK